MIGIRTVLPLCMALSFFAGNCVMPGAVAGGMLDGAASASQEPVLPGLASSSRNDGFERHGYVGDKVCATCHRKEAEAYARTGHRLSSQWPSSRSILGNFDAGANLLVIKQASQDEPGLSFRMDRSSSGFYETAVIGWPGASTKLSERIDVVIGSGRRGQTYLFWKADRLFELPVSFWTKGQRWINSPGYEDGSANFSRPAIPRCLECHATYVQPLSPDFLTNRYVPSTLVLGIDCETCHGPGRSHVRLHLGSLRRKANASENILNPTKFARERQIDLCALCHNGSRQEQLRAAFTYQPGDDLNRYLMSNSKVATVPDVHGDQVGLLQMSRCYLSSPKMTCSTCHDVHAPEQPVALYSAKCLGCHQARQCAVVRKTPASANNCIDCHMPVQQTSGLVSETAGQVIYAKLRSHWIRVYAPQAR